MKKKLWYIPYQINYFYFNKIILLKKVYKTTVCKNRTYMEFWSFKITFFTYIFYLIKLRQGNV